MTTQDTRTQRGYLLECTKTHNTAAIVACKESHARRWWSNFTHAPTWRFVGPDTRRNVESTYVVAVLDEHGIQVHPKP